MGHWNVEKLLSFHSAVPDFLKGKDTPRDYLERCLVYWSSEFEGRLSRTLSLQL